MALYDIERACGHTETIQIYGTNSHGERERRAKWEENKLCADCYQKELQKKRAEENSKSAQSAQEAGLPKLTGSDKQISWAESIRDKFKFDIPASKELPGLSEYTQQFRNVVESLRDRNKKKTEARWWIDNRDKMQGSSVSKIAQNMTSKVVKDGKTETLIGILSAIHKIESSEAEYQENMMTLRTEFGAHNKPIYQAQLEAEQKQKDTTKLQKP